MVFQKKRRKNDNCAYLMIFPAYFIFVVFVLYPIGQVIYYSFTDYNFYAKPEFVGFSNYARLLRDEEFLKSILNTFFYAAGTLLPQLFLGLFFAVCLFRKSRLVPLFRAAIYVPHIMSMVCVSMIWLLFYDPNYGIFNQVLGFFGISAKRWLQDPVLAMPCIVLMSIWKSCGYSMVIYLAGLTNIPEELYEAAKLDGASGLRQFLDISLPLLRPTTFFLLVTGVVNSFLVFEQVNIMTGGGPLKSTTTIVHQIYERGLKDFQMGYAGAMSVILLIFSVLVTLLIFRFGSKGQDIEPA